MYTPRISVEAIPNAAIHHLALQNRDFGHTYDRSRALVKALGLAQLDFTVRAGASKPISEGHTTHHVTLLGPQHTNACLYVWRGARPKAWQL
jgi:hypothetical protein